MGKSRNRSKSEVEFLRGEIRRLKAQLKYCKRCMEKDVDDMDYDDAPEIEVNKHQCSECGKGVLEIVDLKYVIYQVCNTCGFRKKIK